MPLLPFRNRIVAVRVLLLLLLFFWLKLARRLIVRRLRPRIARRVVRQVVGQGVRVGVGSVRLLANRVLFAALLLLISHSLVVVARGLLEPKGEFGLHRPGGRETMLFALEGLVLARIRLTRNFHRLLQFVFGV